MNIEIHKPELEQRVRAHIQSGRFHDTDELLTQAFDALEEKVSLAPDIEALRRKNFMELCDPVRGLAEGVDFTRNPSTARPLDL
jgi:Arc/MetJ-type ribon-helix-helix transcriptional regulator